MQCDDLVLRDRQCDIRWARNDHNLFSEILLSLNIMATEKFC